MPTQAYGLALEKVAPDLPNRYAGFDIVARTDEGVVIYELKVGTLPLDVWSDPRAALPESAIVAAEVRDLSGLSAAKLGKLFPVERETYQRWMAGKMIPSSANLERLLALRHFLRELAHRVQSPKSWLLSPLHSGSSPTAYEALRRGNLADLWDAIADLPSAAFRYTREAADRGTITVIEGSLRGRDYRTSDEELDGYAELLDDD